MLFPSFEGEDYTVVEEHLKEVKKENSYQELDSYKAVYFVVRIFIEHDGENNERNLSRKFNSLVGIYPLASFSQAIDQSIESLRKIMISLKSIKSEIKLPGRPAEKEKENYSNDDCTRKLPFSI